MCLTLSIRRWEVIAVARRSTPVSSGKIRIRNSQSPSPQSGLHVCGDISSSSSSSWKRGASPSRHNQRAWSSVLFWWVCSFRRARPPSHQRGQQIILTSLFSQSTLVLLLSREDSRITQGGCSERTRWSSSLDCSTTYTSSIMAMLLLILDHVSF